MPDRERTGGLETPAGRPNLKTSRCARCGAAFTCGMIAGNAPCWCAAFPQVMPVPKEGAGCYCPACLNEMTAVSGGNR